MNESLEIRPGDLKKRLIHISIVIILGAVTAHFCYISPRSAANLTIMNDEVDYAVGASTWIGTGSYRLPVGGSYVAPQYPYGFPMMLIPFLAFGGSIGVSVICVLFCAVGLVLLTYSLGSRLINVPAGIFAAFLVLSTPLARRMSKHVMADVPSVLLICAVIWSLFMAFETEGRKRRLAAIVLAALCAGLAVAVRLNAIFLILPLVFFVIALTRREKKTAVAAAVIFAAGILIFLIPLLMFNGAHFGSPFRTGYSAWFSWIHDKPGYAFSMNYLFTPAMSWPPDSPHGNLTAYCGSMATFFAERLNSPLDYLGSLLTFLLAASGAVTLVLKNAKSRKFVLLAALTILPQFVLFLFYYYQNERFLLPLLPVMAILAAAGTSWVFRLAWSAPRKFRLPAATLVIAVGIILAHHHAARLFRFEYPYSKLSKNYDNARAVRELTPENAIIISIVYPVYMEHLAIGNSARTFVPLVGTGPVYFENRPPRPPENAKDAVLLGGKRFYPFAAASEEGVRALLNEAGQGREVFIDEISGRTNPEAVNILKKQFDFHPVRAQGGVRIYGLTPKKN
ncbi:MAG: ArnT family glycosyltransferase [Planctomycetota bacterium]|jgi:4-amino-4-deoxy-L-arabinose transferase-like glycosyltransferase